MLQYFFLFVLVYSHHILISLLFKENIKISNCYSQWYKRILDFKICKTFLLALLMFMFFRFYFVIGVYSRCVFWWDSRNDCNLAFFGLHIGLSKPLIFVIKFGILKLFLTSSWITLDYEELDCSLLSLYLNPALPLKTHVCILKEFSVAGLYFSCFYIDVFLFSNGD